MDNTYYGVDWGKGNSKTVWAVYIGGRFVGKTYWSIIWLSRRKQDLLSKHLISRLAAEAIINISINN